MKYLWCVQYVRYLVDMRGCVACILCIDLLSRNCRSQDHKTPRLCLTCVRVRVRVRVKVKIRVRIKVWVRVMSM